MNAIPVYDRPCICGALFDAVPRSERLESLAQVDALDCPSAEKLVRRIELAKAWYVRETAAVRDLCVCEATS